MSESHEPHFSGAELRDSLKKHRSKVRLVRALEFIHRPWIYPLYGRNYEEYRDRFGNLLPDAASLPPNAVLIELMGPGELFRSLQQEGQQVSGIALTLTDLRGIRTRLFDRAHNNSLVTGDILNNSTWQKLDTKLGDRRADLIVCSPGGGDVSIPKSTRVYAGLLDRAYRRLGQDGQLVTDVPAIFNQYLGELEERCHDNGIGFRKDPIPPYSEEYYDSSMVIQKRENAPRSLTSILRSIP